MIKDLVEGDGAKQLVVMQDSTINDLNTKINFKTSELNTWEKKYRACEATSNEYANLDSLNQRTIQALKHDIKKVKRQRNATLAFLGAAIFGILKVSGF